MEGDTWRQTTNAIRTKVVAIFSAALLLGRFPYNLLIIQIPLLREFVKSIQIRFPFYFDGWVFLPHHLQCDECEKRPLVFTTGLFNLGYAEWICYVK